MRNRVFLVISLLLILSTLLSACGGAPAAAPTAAPAQPAATQPAAAPADTAVPATAVPPTPGPMATSVPVTLETFGLKPGKPYDGTHLKFLICCNTASQFYSLNEKTQQFTDLTGITVEWGTTPYAAFQQQILTEGASGSGNYDLVAWVDSWGPGLFNFIEPLDPYIERDGYNAKDFPDAWMLPGISNGQTLGIPLRGHAFTFFYRKDILDKLGLAVPTTWAEFEAAAAKIQEETDLDGTSLYYAVNGGQNIFLWSSLLWSNGGEILDANNKAVFNSPEGVEATQRYVDWLLKQKITSPGAITFAEGEADNEMKSGRAATFMNWSWRYSNYNNPSLVAPEAYGNIAFGQIPSWEGKGTSASYAQIWEAGMFKASKNKEATWEYLKWMLSPETEKWVATDKSDPKRDNVVVVHNSNLLDPDINALHNGLQKNMYEVLKGARTQPLIADWMQVQGMLEIAINEMAGGAPVQETLDKTADEVNKLLKDLGY